MRHTLETEVITPLQTRSSRTSVSLFLTNRGFGDRMPYTPLYILRRNLCHRHQARPHDRGQKVSPEGFGVI